MRESFRGDRLTGNAASVLRDLAFLGFDPGMVDRVDIDRDIQAAQRLLDQWSHVVPGQTSDAGCQGGHGEAADFLLLQFMLQTPQAVVDIGQGCLAWSRTMVTLDPVRKWRFIIRDFAQLGRAWARLSFMSSLPHGFCIKSGQSNKLARDLVPSRSNMSSTQRI